MGASAGRTTAIEISFESDFPPLDTVAVTVSVPISSAVAIPFSILTFPFLLLNETTSDTALNGVPSLSQPEAESILLSPASISESDTFSHIGTVA